GNMDTWWSNAIQVGAPPAPLAPGTRHTFEVANLDSGRTYYFVLRTADEVPNWSEYSNVAVKSTILFPGALATPSGFQATLIPGAVRLAWDEATDGVTTGYALYRRAGGAATAPLVWSGGAGQTSWTDTTVTGGEQYEYSLRATAGAAQSDPAVASVSVPLDELLTATPQMLGMPNPAKGRVTIRFTTQTPDGSAGRVRLVIYDLSGRRIRSLVDESLSPGEHAVDWTCSSDAGNLVAPGVYHAILDAPGGRQILNLAILP
ncbi:MAG TPA: FlgD immunoglobulin-like domain containing protein, partial [Candidatus Eisenbacteria bacterium]|nr:FlgD immunoglobulin-like domain containing protein [Candidatus Eisenbacteria bacterium]